MRLFTLGVQKATDAVLVGFMTQSPVGEGCAMTYDCIAFRSGAPGGLPDGS